MSKIVFLDRDGTINVEKNYVHRIEDFQFIEGSIQGIKLLNDNGYKVFVISNQAGIARGYYSEADVDILHRYVNDELFKQGAHIDGFFYCPHHPEHGVGIYKTECQCRKPRIGMFEQATKELDVDKNVSWMIGDNISDIQAGKNYGVRTILVATGYGKETIDRIKPNYFVPNLYEACKVIIDDK